ncbi:phosphotransferase [Bradyrhizobium yuanmingense]|nr:phosphotransferase [Bradyrhizobium yuanmingense]
MVAANRQSVVRARAEARLGGSLDSLESALTVLASPAWRGIEADIWLARRDDRSEIYKHYHTDLSHYVDPARAIEAAKRAGDIGVGPRVLQSWDEDGLFAMEYLGNGWRAGGLHDSANTAVRKGIVAAKKALQAGPKLSRDADIFSEIRAAYAACTSYRASLPKNMTAFLGFAERAEQAMSQLKIERVPCHRDGNTANIMVGPEDAVRLVDYDLAANADPYEDIGCHLTEVFDREPEARDGFAEWTGFFDEGLYQRAIVYGILDDLRWSLVAFAMAASSPRTTLEFAKYASWRLMRFEVTSQTSTAGDRLRRMA